MLGVRCKISRDVPCGGAMHMLQRACPPSCALDLPLSLSDTLNLGGERVSRMEARG
jgi:hypothetical protein